MVLDSRPEGHAPTHHLAMVPYLAHNCTSQLQYCYLRSMLRAPTSPITAPVNDSIASSAKYEISPAR